MSITNILLALLIFCLIVMFHEFGHFLFAKLCGVSVIEFAVGFGPKIISKKIGETTYSLRLIPFGGFCAMIGEDANNKEKEKQEENYDPNKSFANKPLWQRILITFAGPLFNFILAFVCSLIYIGVYGSPVKAEIATIIPNSVVKDETNLEVGDYILSINGRSMSSYQDVLEYNATHQGEPYTIVTEHNGQKNTYSFTPRYDEASGNYIMGVNLKAETKQNERTFVEIIYSSVCEFRYYIRMVFDSFRMLFVGSATVKDMASVVGIVDMMDTGMTEAREVGGNEMLFSFCMYMLILISANLGIMNLLPLPALDGGRCLLYVIELITKRTLPQKIETTINNVGFGLLMVLMVFLVFNDISRILGV